MAEATAAGVVGEEGLVCGGAGDDGGRGEVGGARRGWVEAPECLLDGFESARDRGRPQVDGIAVGDQLGHELELVHVEMAETLP